MNEDLALAPGGYRPKSRIHSVEPGHSLRISGKKLEEIEIASGEVKRSFPVGESAEVERSLGQSRWVTYARWDNMTGQPVSKFTVQWTVPPEPRTRNTGQTIYLFSGIQDQSNMLLQPVLQWGYAQDSDGRTVGGDYWSIGSWYAGAQGGDAWHSPLPLLQVYPGDKLTGVIELIGKTSNGLSYVSYFDGNPETSLRAEGIHGLSFCCMTLEAYKIATWQDYPDTDCTPMRVLDLRTGTVKPPHAWTTQTTVYAIGDECCAVKDHCDPGVLDEVDLYYLGPPTS